VFAVCKTGSSDFTATAYKRRGQERKERKQPKKETTHACRHKRPKRETMLHACQNRDFDNTLRLWLMKKGLILGVQLNVAQITCSLFSFKFFNITNESFKKNEKDLFC
jgi:hypothetical protein